MGIFSRTMDILSANMSELLDRAVMGAQADAARFSAEAAQLPQAENPVAAAQDLGAAPDSETVREIRELHETLRQAVYGVYLLRELTPRSRDLIVAFGERLSAGAGARYVDSRYADNANTVSSAPGLVPK